jgi:hypothetical protein
MNKRRPVIIGPNTPNWAKETDVWINTVDNTLYRYDGSQWDVIGSYGASVSAVGGFTQEQIEDFAAAMLNHANHTNLTASYNDSTGQISLVGASASSGGASLTQEEVQDFVAPLFNHSNHTNITASYNDGSGQIILTGVSASGGGGVSQATPSAFGTIYGYSSSTNDLEYESNGRNVGLGFNALQNINTNSRDNVAIGAYAGDSLSTGKENILIGTQAGESISSGRENVAVGHKALVNNYGSYNTAIGQHASLFNQGAQYNTAVGNKALLFNQSGENNVAIGSNALYYSTSGSNTGVGDGSLFSNTTGNSNTALGFISGSNLETGSNNTCIGNGSNAASSSSSNSITLGNSSISSLRCQVTSITSLSDERDKTNIEPLSVGLDFINSLNPVKFEWNMRDEAKVGEKDFGFIAQQIIESEDSIDGHDWLKLTLRENPDKLEATQGRLIPILVKAIQELSTEIEALKSQLA